ELAARPEAAWRLGVDTWEANNNRGGFWVANEGAAQPPIPAAVIVGDDLIFDHAGLVKRFSAATGDEQWTSGGHPNDVAPSQLQGRLFAERIGERLLVAGDVHHAGAGPAIHLVCFDLIGRELWSTRKDRDFQGLSVIGVPSHADGTVYAVMQREGTYNLDLVAVSLADGARLWTAPLGTPVSAAASNPWMWMGSGAVLPIAPQVVLTGDEILVVTDSCAVLAVDPVAGRIRWAYTRPVERRFDDGPSPGSSVYLDGILYLRSQGNKNCFALDVAKRKELWTSRVHQSERIVASDEQHLYLLGDNLRAIDLHTGERVWSRPIQVARDTRHIVETAEYLYVLTRRGLFEVEKATGDNTRTPLRGAMSKMGGGDLFRIAGHLVCVGRSEVLAVALGT
ncbi:MAG: PQQ-binding-like beta-propeller repeat protein, partial [Planctomycetota bacterium]|nr:PQQ-binding-like beta-propeller repeat protein [Planctomycetota bacterium]